MKKVLGPILIILFLLAISYPLWAAQVVCIAEGTYRPGINNIGDIVAVQDDGTIDTKGIGYKHMTIYQVKGTKEEVRAELAKKLPDTSELTPEEIEERLPKPKYSFKVVDDKQAAIKDMCGTNVVLSPTGMSMKDSDEWEGYDPKVNKSFDYRIADNKGRIVIDGTVIIGDKTVK